VCCARHDCGKDGKKRCGACKQVGAKLVCAVSEIHEKYVFTLVRAHIPWVLAPHTVDALIHCRPLLVRERSQVWYCSVECQKMDWKEGGLKQECKALQAATARVGAGATGTQSSSSVIPRRTHRSHRRGALCRHHVSPHPRGHVERL